MSTENKTIADEIRLAQEQLALALAKQKNLHRHAVSTLRDGINGTLDLLDPASFGMTPEDVLTELFRCNVEVCPYEETAEIKVTFCDLVLFNKTFNINPD